MENIEGQNNLSKIANQYRNLHNASGTNGEEINSLDDKSLFALFQKDMNDGKLDGRYKTDNGSESIFNGFTRQVAENIDDFLNASPELKNGMINELADDVAQGENIYLWQNPETGKFESNPKYKDLDFETFRKVMTRADDIKSGKLSNDFEGLYAATTFLDENGNFYVGNDLQSRINIQDKGNEFRENFVNKYHDEKSAELENLAGLGYKVLDETAEYNSEWQAANEKSAAMQSQIANINEQIMAHDANEPQRNNYATEEEYRSAKAGWNRQKTSLNAQLQSLTAKFNEHETARNQIIWEANEAVAGEDKTVITRADSPEIVQYKMKQQRLNIRNELSGYQNQLAELQTALKNAVFPPEKQKISAQISDIENKIQTAQAKIAHFGVSEEEDLASGFINKYHDAKSAQLENLYNQGYKVLDETAAYNSDWREANSKRENLELRLADINTETSVHQEAMPQRENFATEEEYNQAKKEWTLKNASLSGLFTSITKALKQNENSRMQIISDANAAVAGEDKTVITRADTPEIIMIKMAQQRMDTKNEITECQQQLAAINKARYTPGALSKSEKADLDAKAAEFETRLKAAQERFAKFGTNSNPQQQL